MGRLGRPSHANDVLVVANYNHVVWICNSQTAPHPAADTGKQRRPRYSETRRFFIAPFYMRLFETVFAGGERACATKVGDGAWARFRGRPDPCDAERAVKRLRPVRKPSGDKTILEFEGIPLSLDDFHRLSPEGYGASCVRAMQVWCTPGWGRL